MFHIKEARKVTDKLDPRHFFASLTLARQNDGENRTDGSRPLITTMPLLDTKLRKEITVCKFQDFSIAQILCEINFGESRSSKTNFLPFFGL